MSHLYTKRFSLGSIDRYRPVPNLTTNSTFSWKELKEKWTNTSNDLVRRISDVRRFSEVCNNNYNHNKIESGRLYT